MPKTGGGRTDAMLEIKGIHSYYGQAHILTDVSLTLSQGEIVVLLGRNGAGKSTTIKSIMGMVHVTEGSISYEGQEILGAPPHAISHPRFDISPRHATVGSKQHPVLREDSNET